MSQSYARGNQGPPGTIVMTEVEVNFGTAATSSQVFTISNALCTTGSKIAVFQSGNAPTGRSADENEMDPIIFSATAGTGNFIVYANSIRGPVRGLYKLLYILS